MADLVSLCFLFRKIRRASDPGDNAGVLWRYCDRQRQMCIYPDASAFYYPNG